MFHKFTLLTCLAVILAVKGAALPGTNALMDPGVKQCAEDQVDCKDGLVSLAAP